VTLGALKHRNISQIDRVLERFVSLVTRLALSIGQAAEINRMLNIDRLDD